MTVLYQTRPRMAANEIREVFIYDSLSGCLRWKHAGIGRRAGQIAGSLHRTGYWTVFIARRHHALHHLVWAYFHGEYPSMMIDHINQVKTDCRIENLRVVTQEQNAWNKGKSSPRVGKYTSSHKGVCFSSSRKKWQASIAAHRVEYHLGSFDSEDQAASAYRVAASLLFGEFSGLRP